MNNINILNILDTYIHTQDLALSAQLWTRWLTVHQKLFSSLTLICTACHFLKVRCHLGIGF